MEIFNSFQLYSIQVPFATNFLLQNIWHFQMDKIFQFFFHMIEDYNYILVD